MSITSDIRAYADSALEQGKQVVGQAQTQLSDVIAPVSDRANEFAVKLSGSAIENVSGLTTKAADLREQAEKALSLDSLKATVDPYLEQAKQYRATMRSNVSATVTGRAEGLRDAVLADERVARAVANAGSLVETLQKRVIAPMSSATASATGRVRRSAPKRPAGKPATKPASTRPAAKSAAKKVPTKTTAQSAAARSATRSSSGKATTTRTTAKKSTAVKAPAAKKASSTS